MVDGLKLTVTGEEMRSRLERRIEHHNRSAAEWKREQARTPEEETEDDPLLPDHICANEAERHEWRVQVLGFIRDHIDEGETYRLGETDLSFCELLPEKPGWLEQDEYEERNRVGFEMGRLSRSLGKFAPAAYAFAARAKAEGAL